jgi:3-phytase
VDAGRSEDQLVRRVSTVLILACVTLVASCGGGTHTSAAPVVTPALVAPTLLTDAVSDDPDDPAIWINHADRAKSLIFGTNKVAAPNGAIVAFGLDGKVRQTISGLDRPNNIDVQQGVRLGDRVVDVAVVTERLQHRLRVFTINPDGSGLTLLGMVPVLEGQAGIRAEPMGISLYLRSSDGALFAIVAPKIGGGAEYLWQYRLVADRERGVRGTLVRRFGNFSERGPEPGDPGEIEAVVVDDALGYVYYADERYGIHKWHADPDSPGADQELAVFGLDGYQADREGLAVYATGPGTGFLVSTDQVAGGSSFKFYPREGLAGSPHVHTVVQEVRTPVDETDGIEVTSVALPGFPQGLMVAMNSGQRNFALFDWVRFSAR